MRATFASTSSPTTRDITPRPEAQILHSAEVAIVHLQPPSPGLGAHKKPSTPHPAHPPSSTTPPEQATIASSPGPPRSAPASPSKIDPATTPTRPPAGLPPFRHVVHDLRTPVHSPNPAPSPFENRPEDIIDLLHFDNNNPTYKPPDAPISHALNMSDSRSTGSTSEQSRQATRGRGMSQHGPSRRPPARLPFQTSASSLYPPPIPSSQENRPATSAAASPFQGPPPPQYAYGQRGAFVGQYTMSTQPPVGMVHHSPPQYAYPPPHPGLHAPDQSMLSPPHNQLLGYSPSTLMPMMQAPSSVYQFPGHSPESSSSSSRSFSNTPAAFSPHTRPQAHPSPPPHSPHSSQPSGPPHSLPVTLPPPHSASYAGQTPYSPLRFSTPPFAYPPHSFAPSPSLYAASQYPSHYPQHYPQPTPEQEAQGTWWYLPPQPASGQFESFQSPYAMSYNPANTREGEQSSYAQQPTSSPAGSIFSMSPTHPEPSPGPSSSSGGQTPYSPPPPFSLQQSPFSQLVTEKSQPMQRSRPPDPGPSTMSPGSSSSRPTAERQAPARRPYHPNPPAHRSEWVMWTGNVPSDATHDELWRFFNSPPSPGSSVGPTSTHSAPAGPAPSSASGSTASTESLYGGVSSIFLISRSNCAFVNFQSEPHLQAAIRHFNGLPLRPNDPRCPRLVCRVRAREDDLKAGVGGQRGAGMHVRWVRDRKEREREATRRRSTSSPEIVTTPSSSPTDVAHILGSLSLSSDDEGGRGHVRKPPPHSSSSGSYASTNSSILTAYFPKRYFILKSLSQFDLDLSVEKGLWATQRHNEGILDQAYRTSKEVYLIFSVNKSGEFYGYAKMAGPIMRGEQRVSWASRTDSPTQSRSSTQSQRDSPQTTRRDRDRTFFSPSEHRFDESPYPMSPETPARLPPTARLPTEALDRDIASAPAEMNQPHRSLSLGTEAAHGAPSLSFDGSAIRPVAPAIAGLSGHKHAAGANEIELDPTAPLRAIRDPRAAEAARKTEEGSLHTVAEEDERAAAPEEEAGRGKGKDVDRPGEDGPAGKEGPTWGEPFKVEWVRTVRLPFTRTRHLRNPWNHDREVKVSRDGTELEPSVGQALLEEWDKTAGEAQPASTTGLVEVGRRLPGKASISVDVLSTPGSTREDG